MILLLVLNLVSSQTTNLARCHWASLSLSFVHLPLTLLSVGCMGGWQVWGLSFGPTGDEMVSCSDDATLIIWRR